MNDADDVGEARLRPEAPPHEPVKVLAVVTDYDTLHAALRARKDELDLSCQVIDRAAALAVGHSSKILAPQQLKKPGWQTLGFLLPALGMKLALLEDAAAVEQLKKFSTRMVKTPARSVAWGRSGTQTVRSLRWVRRIARAGGEARAQKLTPAQRSASARKAAKARWHKPRVDSL
jgi:hypothetical protein